MALIDVHPDILPDIAMMFKYMGVKVVGSAVGEGVITLRIEGDAVPKAAHVGCDIEKDNDGATHRLTAKFRAIRTN